MSLRSLPDLVGPPQAVLVRESLAPPPLAPASEPSAGEAAAAAAVSTPGIISMISMDEDDASPEARQCTAALRDGKRCAPALCTLREKSNFGRQVEA